MQISIAYCVKWNYLPKAAGLAEAIKSEFGTETELIKGSNGIFDVKVDGDLIFSKHKTHRFPEHDEILEMLRK